MPRILSKREKIILYITAGVIISSVFFNFLVAPILKKREILNKEIEISRMKLKKYARLLSQKEYIQNKYNKFVSSVNVSGASQDSLVNALTELRVLAESANIRIIEIRPQAPRIVDLYKEARIDLKTEGSIEGYLKFIYNIENSLSLLRMERFQLSAKPATKTLEGNFIILQRSLPE